MRSLPFLSCHCVLPVHLCSFSFPFARFALVRLAIAFARAMFAFALVVCPRPHWLFWLLCSALHRQSPCIHTFHTRNIDLETSDLDPLPTSPSVLVFVFFRANSTFSFTCCSTNDRESSFLQTFDDNSDVEQISECLFGFVLPGCDSSHKFCHCIHETVENGSYLWKKAISCQPSPALPPSAPVDVFLLSLTMIRT